MGDFLRNNYVNTLLSVVLLVGVFLVIIPSEYLLIKWGNNHAPKLLFAYFFLGLLFLVLDQKRLMFVSLGCTAALAIFLKVMTNSEMKAPIKTENVPTFKLAHFNVQNYNASEDLAAVMQTVLSTEADLISVHETTPLWDSILNETLREDYPQHFFYPDLGLFGMSLFSKRPFTYTDTVFYKEIPNLVGGIQLDKENTLHFISSHTLPALNYRYYNRLKEHLDFIADYCQHSPEPILTFGDYHTVPWSNEVATFRTKTKLQDSRRGFTPTFPHGSPTVFEVPVDHIFFSPDLKCLDFSTISTLYTSHLGIQATFQLKKEDAKKEN